MYPSLLYMHVKCCFLRGINTFNGYNLQCFIVFRLAYMRTFNVNVMMVHVSGHRGESCAVG